jgi:hypothetical protein
MSEVPPTIDPKSPAFLSALGARYQAMDASSEGMSTPLYYAIRQWERQKGDESVSLVSLENVEAFYFGADVIRPLRL